jgi:hypothetical protein
MNDQHVCGKTARHCARCRIWYCDECKHREHPTCPLQGDTNGPTTYAEPTTVQRLGRRHNDS